MEGSRLTVLGESQHGGAEAESQLGRHAGSSPQAELTVT